MTLRALLLILVTIAFGVASFLTPPFTGFDPAQFPVQIAKPAVQPAGYAFAIWSVIYLWLIVHALYGFWARARSIDWDEVRIPLITSLAIGTVWLAVAGLFPLLATVGILFMLATALVAFLQADEYYDPWLLSAPLAIYAGWLSAASAVSVGVVLAGYGILSDSLSAFVMIGVVVAVASLVQWLRPRMPLYGLTVVWALVGIVVANLQGNLIVAAAAGGAAFTIASFTYREWRRHNPSL